MLYATPFRILDNAFIGCLRQISRQRRGGVLHPNGLMVAALMLLGCMSTAKADIVVSGGFGPNGDVGFVNSPPDLAISFASQGSIFQMDGFVNVPGQNLNNTGSGFGTSAELSYGTPTGITYTFSAAQPTADQLLLHYQFTNITGANIPAFQFLSFVDGDIGPNYADESAISIGTIAPAGTGLGATSFQIGDPSESTLFTNLLFGTLDNSNEYPPTMQGDVSTGLGFTFDLAAGASASVNVLLSDDASTLGTLAITQTDPTYLTDTLTVSGDVTAVPEPSAVAVGAIGLTCLLLLRHRWVSYK